MATLASIYHKPADSFVSRQRLAVTRAEELQGHKFEEEAEAPRAVSDGTASASAPTASQVGLFVWFLLWWIGCVVGCSLGFGV